MPSYDPNPKWVNVQWDPKADAAFVPIRRECASVVSGSMAISPGAMRERFKKAYADWFADHQDAVKLFRVASYAAVLYSVDATFVGTKEFTGMDGQINLGFTMLRGCPESYEFCRRAYLVNAGDQHLHNQRDLATRLLKRDPLDRSVIRAMVRDYSFKKPRPEYEDTMFAALQRLEKSSLFQPVDHYYYALAYRYYGYKHYSKKHFDFAIRRVDLAIKALQNEPTDWLEKFRKELVSERDSLQPRSSTAKYYDEG